MIVRSLSHLLNCAADIHPAQKIFFKDEFKFSETARVHDLQDTDVPFQPNGVCGRGMVYSTPPMQEFDLSPIPTWESKPKSSELT